MRGLIVLVQIALALGVVSAADVQYTRFVSAVGTRDCQSPSYGYGTKLSSTQGSADACLRTCQQLCKGQSDCVGVLYRDEDYHCYKVTSTSCDLKNGYTFLKKETTIASSCGTNKFHVIWVLDESGSISNTNFYAMGTFVTMVSNGVSHNPEKVLSTVSAYSFSTTGELVKGATDVADMCTFEHTIQANQQADSLTNIQAGINGATTIRNGLPSNEMVVVVLLTDGAPNRGNTDTFGIPALLNNPMTFLIYGKIASAVNGLFNKASLSSYQNQIQEISFGAWNLNAGMTALLDQIEGAVCPQPINCQIQWLGNWSPCSKTCTVGTQSQDGNVIVQGSNGGQECPDPAVDTRACGSEFDLICGGDVTVTDPSSCQLPIANYYPSVSAGCNPSSCGPVTYKVNNVASTTSYLEGPGTYEVEFSRTCEGLTKTCTRSFTITDGTGPVLQCPSDPVTIVLDEESCTSSDLTAVVASGTDNCDSSVQITYTYTFNGNAVDKFDQVGTYIVTATASDAAGTTSTCVFEVDAVDGAPPSEIEGCKDLTVEVDQGKCDVVVTKAYILSQLDLTATDNCVTFQESDFSFSVDSMTIAAGAYTDVTITASDGVYQKSCTVRVSAIDTQDPTLQCENMGPLPVNSLCVDEVTQAEVLSLGTGADNCGIKSKTVVGGFNTQNLGPGTHEFTIEVVDLSDRKATCTVEIELVDNTPPTVEAASTTYTILAPNTLGADCTLTFQPGSLIMNGFITASDNCPGPTPLYDGDATITLGLEGGTVQFGAVDGASIDATQNTVVTLVTQDKTAPVIQCPTSSLSEPLPIDLSANFCKEIVDVPDKLGITISDNCGGASFNQREFEISATSVTTIVLGGNDGRGNNAQTCTVYVQGIDKTAPTLTCPESVPFYFDENSCSADIKTWLSTQVTSFSDSCFAKDKLTVAVTPAELLTLGEHVYTVTVTDPHGNVKSCDVKVTGMDDEEPKLVCKPSTDASLNVDPGTCHATIPSTFDPTGVYDACDNDVDVFGPYLASNTDVEVLTVGKGTTTVYWKATDNFDNFATCATVITVKDNIKPVLVCPTELVTVPLDQPTCSIVVNDVVTNFGITATDNCPGSISYGGDTSVVIGKNVMSITITADDTSLQQASCTFSVQGIDATPPQLTCQDATEVLNPSCDFDVTKAYIAGKIISTLEDTCDGSIQDLSKLEVVGPTSLSEGPNVFTLTVTNAQGLKSTCTKTITGLDQTDPNIDCAAVAPNEVELDELCSTGEAEFKPTATDTCGNSDVVIELVPGDDSAPFIGVGTFTQTWKADDADGEGNDYECSTSITTVDMKPPTITGCPGQTVDYVLPPNTCKKTVDILKGELPNVVLTASDNCFGKSGPQESDEYFTWEGDTKVDLEPSYVGPKSVSITLKDYYGRSTTCNFNINVIDNTKPTVTFSKPTGPFELDENCQYDLSSYLENNFGIQHSDACGSVLIRDQSVNALGLGASSFVYIARDPSQNEQSIPFVLEGVDAEAPKVNCQKDVTLFVNDNCMVENTVTATAVDNCDSDVELSSDGPATFNQVDDYSITFTAKDDSTNVGSCVSNVRVVDQIPPSLVCYSGEGPLVVSMPNDACQLNNYDLSKNSAALISVSDNCDEPTLKNTIVNLVLDVPKSVTITAEDDSEESSTCTFSVVAKDTTDPKMTCPGKQTVAVGSDCLTDAVAFVHAMIQVSDNCQGSTVAPSTGLKTVGTHMLDFTATDGSGNTDECTVEVEVVDNTVPTITCPSPTAAERTLDASCKLANTFMATATDNCQVDSVVGSSVHASLTTFGHGTYSLGYTATDVNGKTSSCSVSMTTIDATPPVFTKCPTSIVEVDLPPTGCTLKDYDFKSYVEASDACDGNDLVWGNTKFTLIGDSEVDIVIEVADQSGKKSQCAFKAKGKDVTPPTFTCPPNSNVDHAAETCTTRIPTETFKNAIWDSYQDNCKGIISTPNNVVVIPAQSSVSGVGEASQVLVNVVVTDGSNTVTTCSFYVEGEDLTPPELICPAIDPQPLDPITCTKEIDITGDATVYDACTKDIQVRAVVEPTILQYGTQVVTLIATDGSGLSTTCTSIIEGVDSTPPLVTCPSDMLEFQVQSDCNLLVPDFTDLLGFEDSCGQTQGPAKTWQTDSNSGYLILGEKVQVTLHATDKDGNEGTCSFYIQATDGTAPTIECPKTLNVDVLDDCTYTIGDFTKYATTFDSCDSSMVVTQSPASGTVMTNLLGDSIVTLSVQDDFGQSASCEIVLKKQQPQKPAFGNCPSSMALSTETSSCSVTKDFGLTASDACGRDVVVVQDITTFGLGSTTVTVTATDADSHISTCSFPVTVTDDTAVQVTTCPQNKVINLDEACSKPLSSKFYEDILGEVQYVDNCPGVKVDYVTTPLPSTLGISPVQLNIVVEDAGGAKAYCQLKVIGKDITPPIMNGCPLSDVELDLDNLNEQCMQYKDFRSMILPVDTCYAEFESDEVQNKFLFGLGPNSVTITQTDGSGNVGTCKFNVIGKDVTAPHFTKCGLNPPANAFVLGPNCKFNLGEVNYFKSLVAASDKCNPAAPTITRISADGPGVKGANSFVYQVADAAGNVGTNCEFTMVGLDKTPPLITCPGTLKDGVKVVEYNLLDDCTYPNTLTATATDTCDGQRSSTQNGPTKFELGSKVVTFSTTDLSGNSATCKTTVIGKDVTGPVFENCPAETLKIMMPADCNKEPNGSCSVEVDFKKYFSPSANAWITLKATDTCDKEGSTVTYFGTKHVIHLGENEVTVYAKDGRGNTSPCTFTVIGKDAIRPQLFCPEDQIVEYTTGCSAELPMDDYLAKASATDNCAIQVSEAYPFGIYPIASSCQCFHGEIEGLNKIQLRFGVKDTSNNERECTFWVTPKDKAPPSITCPYGPQEVVEIVLDENCEKDITNRFVGTTLASDACKQGVTVTQDVTTIGTSKKKVTMTATDAAGNKNTCSFYVQGVDETIPTMTCPGRVDVTLESDGCDLSVPDINPTTLSDSCHPNKQWVRGVDFVQTGDEEMILGSVVYATITATDAAGNQAICQVEVAAIDNVAPSITCPGDKWIELDENCEYWLGDFSDDEEIVAGDNCDKDVTITQSPEAGTSFSGVGSSVVTLTATDDKGNAASCTFKVTRKDMKAPTFTCPGPQPVPLDAETCSASFDFTQSEEALNGADNCGGPLTYVQDVTSATAAGTYTVTMYAVDTNNVKSDPADCTFVVTAVDSTAPQVVCPASQSVALDDSCEAPVLVDGRRPSAWDACGIASDDVDITTVFDTDGNLVTFTAVDVNGNQASCQYTLTGVDSTLPKGTCDDVVDYVDENCELNNIEYTVDFTDECPGDLTYTPSTTSVGLGTTGVTILVTDANGNEGECGLNVIAKDKTPPSITCASEVISKQLSSEDCALAEVDLTQYVTVSDNCQSEDDVQITQSSYEVVLGSQTIIMTATDGSGNEATCELKVLGVDKDVPVVECPDTQFIACGGEIPDLTDTPAQDTCGGSVTVTQSVETLATELYEITLTFKDVAGNSKVCTVEVKEGPCPIDCVPNPFPEWNDDDHPCSKICGGGTRTRKTTPLTGAAHAGMPCVETDTPDEGEVGLWETETCNEQPCSCTARVVAGVDYTYQNDGRHWRQLQFALAQLHQIITQLQYTLHEDLVHFGIEKIYEFSTEQAVNLDEPLGYSPDLLQYSTFLGITEGVHANKYTDFVGFVEKALTDLDANAAEGQEKFLVLITDGLNHDMSRKKLAALYNLMDAALGAPESRPTILCYRPNTWVKDRRFLDRYCKATWTQQSGELQEKNRYKIGFEMANAICPTRVDENGTDTSVSENIENPCIPPSGPIRNKKVCNAIRRASDGSIPVEGEQGYSFCVFDKKKRSCKVKPMYEALFQDDQDSQGGTDPDTPDANDPCAFLYNKKKCTKLKAKVGSKKVKICNFDQSTELCNLKPEFAGMSF